MRIRTILCRKEGVEMEKWELNDLIEIKNDWKKLAQEQAEKLEHIRELINDEHITKSETVDKISKIVNA